MTVDESKKLTLGTIIADSDEIFRSSVNSNELVILISIERIETLYHLNNNFPLEWVREGLYSHYIVSTIFEGEL